MLNIKILKSNAKQNKSEHLADKIYNPQLGWLTDKAFATPCVLNVLGLHAENEQFSKTPTCQPRDFKYHKNVNYPTDKNGAFHTPSINE